jgi:PKD repeat protein
MLFGMHALAGTIKLAWNPVTDPSLAGYAIYYGPSAGNYPSRVDVGNVTSYTVSGLIEGSTYHFAVTAYDFSHAESGYSNDAVGTVPYNVPVANFTASTTSGTVPLALNFTNTSTGTIASYAWTFGDGGTSVTQNPVYVYTTAGVYTVSLTVTGPGGSNTKTLANFITASTSPLPIATTTTLSSSANPSASGSSVTFTAIVTGSALTGTVAFLDGGAPIAGCASVPLGNAGNTSTASCSIAALTVGTHDVVASYSGDSGNTPSTSATLMQVIVPPGGLVNAGFESPNLGGGYLYSPSAPAWQFVNAGITGNANPFTISNPPAPEGAQVAFLQGYGSSATQTASIAAGTYTVTFQAAQRGYSQLGTQVIQVLVDGAVVGQFQPPDTSYMTYQTPPFTISAGGDHTLMLHGVGGGVDFTAFIDAVQLAPTLQSSLANAGFELPNLGGGYLYSPSAPAWQFVNAGITGNANPFTIGNPPAPEGAQVAFLQGYGSSATQTASIAAGTYTMTFQAAQRGNFQLGTQMIQVLVDGAVVGQFQPPDTSYTTYRTPPFTISAGGDHTLVLQGVGGGGIDFTAFVDTVQLFPVIGGAW